MVNVVVAAPGHGLLPISLKNPSRNETVKVKPIILSNATAVVYKFKYRSTARLNLLEIQENGSLDTIPEYRYD
jgi:hypothetical protein